MTSTKREFIIATFIISCIATVLSIVSMATEVWITANLKSSYQEIGNSYVEYGLFKGMILQFYLSSGVKDTVTISCIFPHNSCGFSTAREANKRYEELLSILDGSACVDKQSTTNKDTKLEFAYTPDISNEIGDKIHNYNSKKYGSVNNQELDEYFDIEYVDSNKKIDKMRYTAVNQSIANHFKSIDDSTTTDTTNIGGNVKCDPTFLNGGLWLMTTFFLSLSIVMGAATATFSVINIAGNPISPWLNIWGLYIWNGFAAIFLLLTLILWGIEYSLSISYNVGVVQSLAGIYKNQFVNLGYSYWMILAPFFLHLINIGLLYFRQYLMLKEPQITENTIDTHNKDGMIFVY